MKYINAGQFQEFTLDLSDREIYNDIRSECDIWEILEIRPDATPEFMDEYTLYQTQTIPPAQQRLFMFRAPSDHRSPHFIGAYISSLHSETTESQAGIVMGTPNFNSTRSEMWVYVHNRWGTPSRPDPHTFTVTVTARYYALDPAKRFIKLRSYDAESILKYGRRVMDLVWPLGQHPNQMQAILDNYLQRHKEPVVFANMLMMGKDRETTELALDLDINDRVQLTHPILNINEQFFVENLDCLHDINGTLEAYIDFQQVRDEERLRLFRLACDDDYEYEPIEGCESECVVGSLLACDDDTCEICNHVLAP